MICTIFSNCSFIRVTMITTLRFDSDVDLSNMYHASCIGLGAPPTRRCFNFTTEFQDSFNSWHLWVVNYTQDVLAKTTGGPVIQGPYASMNNQYNISDPNYCDFDAILSNQSNTLFTVFEARGLCQPTESCLAAYLAAAEKGTYMHCSYSGPDLLNDTSFAEMDYPLGRTYI